MSRIIIGSMSAGITTTIAVYQTIFTHNWLWILLYLANILWAGLIIWGGIDMENELLDAQIALQHSQENQNDKN
jgi:hypothetical protein